ncbi:MAG: S8 family serine peptidase [Verrucomicrobiales bacterium]|nr:S8 family serine peptidase [Verrucomicrobiales bacterium]
MPSRDSRASGLILASALRSQLTPAVLTSTLLVLLGIAALAESRAEAPPAAFTAANHPLPEMLDPGVPAVVARSGQEPGEVLIKLRQDSPTLKSLQNAVRTSGSRGLSALGQSRLAVKLAGMGAQGLRPVFRVAEREPTRPTMAVKSVSPADRALAEARKGLFRWYRLEVPTEADLEEFLAAMRSDPEVELAEKNFHWQLCAGTPPPITGIPDNTTDPEIGQQWFLNVVKAQQAWDCLQTNGATAGGSHDVIVAVIDTGVDGDHEELAGNMWVNPGEVPDNGIDDDDDGFVDDVHGCSVVSDPRSHSGDSSDYTGHGTHVAGVIAATAFNGLGGAGVAFNVQIMSVRAAQYSGVLTTTDAAEGILYAIDHGAEVINMSFGGYQASQVMFDALEVALNKAALIAAAGNDNLPAWGAPLYPAALPYVLGVEATQPPPYEHLRTWFSNYGYDIAAPGESIFSTLPGNQYAKWSGTSMAAPAVSGVAALMRSFFWQRDVYSSRFLMGAIFGSKSFGEEPGYESAGLVDAYGALTRPPKPGVDLLENWLFDNEGISPENDNDGRVDSGETIHLGIELINRSGQADEVIAILEARVLGAIQDDPYVSIDVPLVDFGSIGPFNTSDNGFLYSQEGVITNVVWPFAFTVSPDCPNDHVINFILTIDFMDGWDPEHPWYERVAYFQYVVQRGRNVPAVISTDTTLTADEYWMVARPVLVEAGATLTIEPGTQLQWGSVSDDPYNPGPQNGSILVRGRLEARGAADQPISMFPSYLVAGQNTRIAADDGGVIDLQYTKVRNPDLQGLRSLDHCYLDWDAHGATVSGVAAANSIFHRLRGGGQYLDADRFKTCLFDASWMPPKPQTPLYDCAFLQDSDNPLWVDVPCSFRDTLTTAYPDTEPLFLQLRHENGETFVLLPMEWASLQVAELIAGYFAGHVASVPDAATETFLEGYVGTMPRLAHSYHFVIGLTDEGIGGQTGAWHWLDGSALSFSNWAEGFPVGGIRGPSQLVDFAWHDGNGAAFGWKNAAEASGARLPDWHDWRMFILRLPGEWTMEELEAPFRNHAMLDYVRTRHRDRVQFNAFLNRYWDPDIGNWLRVRSPQGIPHGIVSLQENYWGTDSTTLLDYMLVDFYDDFTSARIDYGTPPEYGYPTTYPFVEQVLLNGIPAATVPELGMGRAKFELVFNRDMNTNVEPFVTFGPFAPYTDFQVKPRDEDFLEMTNGWVNARTWSGDVWMTPVTGNGYHLMRISGAVAADDPWLVTGYDIGRFRFKVQTMGVAAMRLQANGAEGGIELLWQQDDYDLLAGYNLYRSATIDGAYERLNTTVIPKGSERFVDTDVTPAVPMFYKFTVVTTDFQESDFSNVASAAAVDTIPPVLEHAAVTSANGGRSLRLTARATDNVRVVSVSVLYRPAGSGGEFTRLEMVNLSGNDWSATIPGSQVGAPGLEYYVRATDGISSVYSGTAATPHTVVVVNQPAVTAVSPNHGPAGGGTTVSVSGLLFQADATVLFGEALASEVVVLSGGQITCQTPPHFPATVDVKVINPDDTEGVLLNGFRFETDETVVALPRTSGDYGTEVEVPLTVANVTAMRAASATVTFDVAVVQLLEVTPGPLAVGWSLSANTSQPGRAVLSLASATSVTGSGVLAILRFQVNGTPPASTALTLESALLNDGAISVERSHGRFEVNAFWNLAGTVNHFAGRAVPNAQLRLLGTDVTDTATDTQGVFGFAGLPTGDYTLTVSKADDLSGISSLDASLILRQEAGLVALSEAQRLAADVNANSAITAMDASYVLEHVVGLRSLPFPGAGRNWRFLPESRTYAPLHADLTGQDFTAILIGDVTGNWGADPDPARAVALAGQGGQGNSLSLRRQDLSDGAVRWWVVANVTQSDLYALDLILTASGEASLAGAQARVPDRAESFSLASNASEPGSLRVAMASALPARGIVPLLNIDLPAGSDLRLELGSFQANEGQVPLAADPDGLRLDQDSDGDGLSDWSEVLAGTDALSGESRLRMLGVDLLPDGRKRIRWASIPGRTYQVQFKDRLSDTEWQDLDDETPAAGESAFADDAALSGERYYRVMLQR